MLIRSFLLFNFQGACLFRFRVTAYLLYHIFLSLSRGFLNFFEVFLDHSFLWSAALFSSLSIISHLGLFVNTFFKISFEVSFQNPRCDRLSPDSFNIISHQLWFVKYFSELFWNRIKFSNLWPLMFFIRVRQLLYYNTSRRFCQPFSRHFPQLCHFAL